MTRHSVESALRQRTALTLLSLNAPISRQPAGSFAADPEITETLIRLSRLPARFDGLRIVQLTDIHLGLYTGVEEVQRVVELANSLAPDVVALTGDYVTFSAAYIRPVARELGRLRSRLGTFAVLGNHDFRTGAEALTRALSSNGIHVLRNARHALHATRPAVRTLKTDDKDETAAALWLVGIDDPWMAFPDLPGALQSIPAYDPKILLCHNPESVAEASRHGVDLMLSGHTHGGQVRLPFLRSLYRSKPGERFVAGWNRLGETQIYVSRGIGKVVVPLRVACPPEIACLTLRRE